MRAPRARRAAPPAAATATSEVSEAGTAAASEEVARLAEGLADEGYVVCRRALPAEAVGELRGAARDELARFKSRLAEIQGVPVASFDAVADGFVYAEIAHRSPRRYDMQLLAPPLLDRHGRPRRVEQHVAEETAASLARWVVEGRESAAWWEVAKRAVGDDAVLHFAGCITSEPGAVSQALHVDGEHLFGASAEVETPPYAVTVFIPLVNTSLEAGNGPTQFVAGTHTSTAAAAREGARVASAGEGGQEYMLAGATRDAEAPTLCAGDAVLADYRVVHRGLANTSSSSRPLLYLTIAAPWWADCKNFGTRSVWDA